MYALVPLLVAADGMHHSEAHGAGYRRARRQDAMVHLLNLVVWPNIFESSPHVINAVMEAIEGMRCCLGQTRVLQHVLQGLFHPARKVREVYWRVHRRPARARTLLPALASGGRKLALAGD